MISLASTCDCCERKARAASAQCFTLWQQATIEITCHDHSIIACSCHIYTGVVLRAHPIRGESHIKPNANGEVATTSLLFTTNRTNHTFFLWRLHLARPHILVTAPFCCDRKARAAIAQSLTLWQQAAIEITCHDHSFIACSCHIHRGVVFRAHPVRGESHIQHNANGGVATWLPKLLKTIF